MTKIKEIYKCNICGNVVEVLENGVGTLVCCGQDMELIKEAIDEVKQTSEEVKETAVETPKTPEQELNDKHKPVIEKKDNKIVVTISKNEHPMTKDHHINWIEVSIDGSIYMKKLNLGDKPVFEIKGSGKKISARALCNIHGLWKTTFEE